MIVYASKCMCERLLTAKAMLGGLRDEPSVIQVVS